MSKKKEISQEENNWLPHSGVFLPENKLNIYEQIEKLRKCVRALHQGEYYKLKVSDMPYAIGGSVSATNLKTLIVHTGLHLPNPEVNDGRTHYDDKEAWSIQEAKWAEINPESNYATQFPADCTAKGLKNWFDEKEIEPRTVSGNWSRAMKCSAERFLTNIKKKELEEGIHTEESLRDDFFDREGDIENTLCALYRSFPKSDVFFFGQDLFNITGCDVMVKVWNTDNWIPLRSYFDALQRKYHTEISSIPYRKAKNAGKR
jgi:hypothetical protein